jgi:hypothetical protein
MMEKSKEMDKGEKKTIVVDWIAKFEKTGEIGEIDVAILKEVFIHCGADFEKSPETLALLGEYTNKAKRPGLDTVWGKESVDGFWKQIDTFIEKHENATGIDLPKLKKSGHKFSGMRQFFGEITALAAGQLSPETFKKYSEARLLNGRKWQEGKKDERTRVTVPTKERPILLSSYPPEYPRFAIDIVLTKGL